MLCCHLSLDFNKEILLPFGLNLFAGFSFALLIYGLQRARYFFMLNQKFNGIKFDVYYKYGGNKIGEVRCEVKGNRIQYKGRNFGKNIWDTEYEGEFIMNELNLKVGEGFHYHTQYNGFNFPKMIIQNKDTIFIESSYYHFRDEKYKTEYWADSHMEVPQAFVWRRQKENAS